MGWVKVVGVGPGSLEYITKRGEKVIAQADVVVGAKEILETFAPAKKHLPLTNVKEALLEIKNLAKDLKVAVLLRGDTGFYSLLRKIEKEEPGLITEVVPGVSSVQLAFARLKKLWDEACFYSLHGRDIPLKLKEEYKIHVFLLGEKISARPLKKLFAEHGLETAKYYLLFDLSYPEETIIEFSFREFPEHLQGRGILIVEG